MRRLRIRAHKTLKEVSEATGLSISFISALERGGSGASVASLRLLAGAYGVNMREVFGADLEQNSPLVRSSERPVMQWDNGVRFEEMASGEKVMDPSYIRVPPGAGSEGFYSHNGEEFIYVISGRLFVELKDQGTFKVAPGDTLYFPSTTPHRWWAERGTRRGRLREHPADLLAGLVPETTQLDALLSIPALFGPCVSPDGGMGGVELVAPRARRRRVRRTHRWLAGSPPPHPDRRGRHHGRLLDLGRATRARIARQ